MQLRNFRGVNPTKARIISHIICNTETVVFKQYVARRMKPGKIMLILHHLCFFLYICLFLPQYMFCNLILNTLHYRHAITHVFYII